MNLSKPVKFFVAFLIFVSIAHAQTGGNFTITQSVVAGGGGQNAAGGTFSLDGTIGQAVAGNAAVGSPFAVTSGFWNFTPLAPTAALVGVGGQVKTAQGVGIRNAIIALTDPTGAVRSARTGAFGYFRFDGVAVGTTYIFTVSSKRFTFSQPAQAHLIQEETDDIVFVADF